MSVIFSTTYWLLGDGADEEAKKWIAEEPHKEILWSSDKAVLLCEEGNYLSPFLPRPPHGFVIVLISNNEMEEAVTLGVSHWSGAGGMIVPERN